MQYVCVYIYICSIQYTVYYILIHRHIYIYIHLHRNMNIAVSPSGSKIPASKWMIRGEGYGPQICGPKVVPFKELTYRFAYPTYEKGNSSSQTAWDGLC